MRRFDIQCPAQVLLSTDQAIRNSNHAIPPPIPTIHDTHSRGVRLGPHLRQPGRGSICATGSCDWQEHGGGWTLLQVAISRQDEGDKGVSTGTSGVVQAL